MMEELMKMDKEVATILIAIGFPILLGMVSVVACYWHKVRKAEIEANLKLKLLEQGMSADEIVRVIEASVDRRGAIERIISA